FKPMVGACVNSVGTIQQPNRYSYSPPRPSNSVQVDAPRTHARTPPRQQGRGDKVIKREPDHRILSPRTLNPHHSLRVVGVFCVPENFFKKFSTNNLHGLIVACNVIPTSREQQPTRVRVPRV